jgi:drug/metabolite transporter (DMT)-like permease
MQPPTSEYVRGAFYGLVAVCIWAAFIVVSRLGVRTTLTPWDVAAIRFAVAGALLFPHVIRKGLALDRLSWIGIVAIVLAGAPMVLLVNIDAGKSTDKFWINAFFIHERIKELINVPPLQRTSLCS